MKLSTRQIIALLICLIFVSENYIMMARKHRSMRRRYHTAKFKVTTKEDYNKTINTNNALFAWIVGVVESLGDGDTKWMRCLPQKWTKDVKENVEENSPVEQKFNGWNDTLQKVFKGIGTVVDIFCKVKGAVASVIAAILGDDEKNRKLFYMFMEGKMKRRRFRNKWGLFTWVKNTAGAVWNKVKDKVNKAWKVIEDRVKTALDVVKEEYIIWKKRITDFLQHPIIKEILQIVECIISAKDFVMNIKEVITKAYTKITNVVSSFAKPPPYPVFVITDLIVGLICNWAEFKTAIDFFFVGSGKQKRPDKWYWYGRGMGQVFRAAATADTVLETLQGDKRKLKRRFKKY